jgi:hypothetical protein
MRLPKRRSSEVRREERQRPHWRGQYLLADEAWLGWFDCRVLDVSRMGAGLELYGPSPASDDWDLIVRLQPSGEAFVLQLRGHVRYETPCEPGGLRVGIEFVDMTPVERHVLERVLAR